MEQSQGSNIEAQAGIERPAEASARPEATRAWRIAAHGKFLFARDRKFYVKGVGFGPLAGDSETESFGHPKTARRDFRKMTLNGINTVRVWLPPPVWLLDEAAQYDLKVLVGLRSESRRSFPSSRQSRLQALLNLRDTVRQWAGHPALLGVVLGQEIGDDAVRWYGPRRVEQFVRDMHLTVKEADPHALTTMLVHARTELLDLAFLDLIAFQVVCSEPAATSGMIDRLHGRYPNRPLLLTDLGCEDRADDPAAQAMQLDHHLRLAFARGCAGVSVMSWTDEWTQNSERPGATLGVTDRSREPKPALAALRQIFTDSPFPVARRWPRASVVVCTHRGARGLEQSLAALQRLEYPEYELIVAVDATTQAAVQPASGFQVVQVSEPGIAAMRNAGAAAATGEFIAFIDAGAEPDPHWLNYLAQALITQRSAAVGGTTLSASSDRLLDRCMAHAPGAPAPVLLDAQTAEHLPGCNLAVRRQALELVGGFDSRFRHAGEDVDLCWRLQERGGTLGYEPAAVVWSSNHGSLRRYAREQAMYGAAECALEAKWPHKFTGVSEVVWAGQPGERSSMARLSLRRWRMYESSRGNWFTSPLSGALRALGRSMPLMPEWYLLIAALMLLAAPAVQWRPMWFAAPVPLLALAVPLLYAAWRGATAKLDDMDGASRGNRFKARCLIGLVHVIQPVSRLWGRMHRRPLQPQQTRGRRWVLPRRRTDVFHDKHTRPWPRRVEDLANSITRMGGWLVGPGPGDRWDLEIRGGLFGRIRVQMLVEDAEPDTGGGQNVYLRAWPYVTFASAVWCAAHLAFTVIALWSSQGKWNHLSGAAVLFAAIAACLMVRMVSDIGVAASYYRQAIKPPEV